MKKNVLTSSVQKTPVSSCKEKLYIGVDPGLSGAIAAIGPETLLTKNFPCLNDGTKRYLNIIELRDLLIELVEPYGKDNCLICLEKSQPMPRDGVMGSFRYGEAYGILKGLFVSMEFPLMEVAPITWKTKMIGKGKDKDASRMLASQLYPQLGEFLKLKKDHGKAEALLLAEYGKRIHSGKNLF